MALSSPCFFVKRSQLDARASRHYTQPMKRTCMIPLLFLMLMLFSTGALVACTPGDLGSEEIAFLRNGKLWTIDPNGANAFEAVAQDTEVLGYGLSPDHQLFVFRTLDSDFAKTAAGQHLVSNPITGLVSDVPSTLNVIGIDGGTPIPIILSSPNISHSAAWWSPDGVRLLYREGASTGLTSPALVTWWSSQSDQPNGIARKSLPISLSIPSFNANSSEALGNSPQGIFTTTLTGTDLTYVQHGALAGHPLAASLERILWQPVQQNPALLYALASPPSASGQAAFTLVLRTANGQTRTLTTCSCRQFAWSPDGQEVLYSTDKGYTILNVQQGTTFNFSAEHGAVPYWSPDSRALLLDGLHTLTLVHISSQQVQVILSDGNAPVMTDGALPDSTTFLQPVANNLWNVDGQRFVLATRGRTLWQGQQLGAGNGLYVVTLNGQDEPQGLPALVDRNAQDTQPGWSYEDPNTSFLF